MIEILYKNKRVAVHVYDSRQGRHTTITEHMPKSHQKYLEWTPSRLVSWAGQNGPQTKVLVTCIMENRTHSRTRFPFVYGNHEWPKNSPVRWEACLRRA
jgi:predicted ATP-grasp superfamily ATP-dependent carboligase